MGYRKGGAGPPASTRAAGARLPARTVTWFSHGTYDRLPGHPCANRGQVIGLPLISGGREQHMPQPLLFFFPIPFAPGMLAGVAGRGPAPIVDRAALHVWTTAAVLHAAGAYMARRPG